MKRSPKRASDSSTRLTRTRSIPTRTRLPQAHDATTLRSSELRAENVHPALPRAGDLAQHLPRVERLLRVHRPRCLQDERLRASAHLVERFRRGEERGVVEPAEVNRRGLEGGAELAHRRKRPGGIEGDA